MESHLPIYPWPAWTIQAFQLHYSSQKLAVSFALKSCPESIKTTSSKRADWGITQPPTYPLILFFLASYKIIYQKKLKREPFYLMRSSEYALDI